MSRAQSVPSSADRGILTIASWTAIGHAVALGAAPFLTRLYTPDEYGRFALLVAIAAVVGTAPALRYEFTVPLPSSDEDARALVWGGLGLSLLFLGTVLPVTLFAEHQGWLEKYFSEVDGLFPWVPALATAYAVFRLLNQWAIRQQAYSRTGRRNFFQSATTAGTQISLGVSGASAFGLWWGALVGQLAGIASLSIRSGLCIKPPHLSRIVSNLRGYVRFALTLTPAGLINASGIFVPIVMLAALYSAEDVGAFGLATQLVSVPLVLLGQAIAQVYLGELSRRSRDGGQELEALFFTATKRLALLAAVLLVVLLIAPPLLFPPLLGQAWDTSGLMAQALSLTVCAQFISSPLSQTLIVLERTGIQLIWDATRLLFAILVFVVCADVGASAVQAVWVFSLTSAAMYGWAWLLSRHALRRCS